jgi:hypothetical protein
MECKEAHEGSDERVVSALDFGYRLPEGGWRRVLALWGGAAVLFFRGFHAP